MWPYYTILIATSACSQDHMFSELWPYYVESRKMFISVMKIYENVCTPDALIEENDYREE
jgi:hypothetical protein